MSELTGKVAVVTGGNQGIGKAIAAALVRSGARVVIAARQADKLAAAAADIGGPEQALAVPTDVRDEQQVARLFARTVEAFGRVDLLVNNAGAFDGGPVEDVSLEAWERVVGACLTGAFLCTREAFRLMKSQGGGRILNIGSISAQRPRMHSAPYTSAKHGIWGLTQATALEGRAHGIVVSCLHPGNVLVERRMADRSGPGAMVVDQDEPMITMDEIAAAAVHMLSQPAHVNFLEAIVMPTQQLYIGRG